MTYELNLELIKQKREQKKMTLQQMADALGIKDRWSYYKRENGDYQFKASEIPLLVTELGIPYQKIFDVKLRKSQQKDEEVSK